MGLGGRLPWRVQYDGNRPISDCVHDLPSRNGVAVGSPVIVNAVETGWKRGRVVQTTIDKALLLAVSSIDVGRCSKHGHQLVGEISTRMLVGVVGLEPFVIEGLPMKRRCPKTNEKKLTVHGVEKMLSKSMV